MEMLVRLDGVVKNVLERLVGEGYYKTKAEAVRAGILELGREYAFIGSREARLVSKKIRKMEDEVKRGNKKFISIEEIAKKEGIKI